MSLEDDLRKQVKSTFGDAWTERDGQVVPAPKDVALGNVGVNLEAAVLYADLRGSTDMVNSQTKTFAGEVYKTYLHCAGKIINDNGGVITAYDGDRIMAVFIGGTKNTDAARTALRINYAVKKIINPEIEAIYGGGQYSVKHVVGVDSGKLMVARTGVWGNNDLVWIGPAANYAAKLTELGQDGHSSYLTNRVYDSMLGDVRTWKGKSVWEERSWKPMKNMRIYRSNWTWTL